MLYKVLITETLEKIVEVEAATEGQALADTIAKYKDSEIVLSGDDCTDFDIEIIKENK